MSKHKKTTTLVSTGTEAGLKLTQLLPTGQTFFNFQP